MVMKGLTLSSLKGHPALIPLFVFLGIGVGGSVFYTLRIAIKDTETTWNRKGNPEPWNEFENKQYKFYSPTMDYTQIKSQAPKY